jgi:hypothetical protein
MFKDYKYEQDFMGYSEYLTIVDSEFVSTLYLAANGPVNPATIRTIIKIYEDKKLNVAKNLALYILLFSNRNAWFKIDGFVKNCQTFIPGTFNKYQNDLQKYLLLK